MRKVSIGILTGLLWLASVGLGMAAIPTSRDLLLVLYVQLVSGFGRYPNRVENALGAAATVNNFAILILGLVVLIYAIGSGEYVSRHIGARGVWKLLGWAFAVELGIFLLGFFF